jgi:hypothetical protein
MSKESIKQKFLDPHHPASFTTVSNFVKNNDDLKDPQFVKDVLTDLRTYGMYAPVRKRFPRRRVITSFVNEIHACDLADVSKYALTPGNKRTRFLCVYTDLFSKYMWVYPMKDKGSSEMLRVMKEHLGDEKNRCRKIWMDRERSAYSKIVLSYLASINVTLYSTGSPLKSVFAEVAIRILKTRIEKWIHYSGSKKYIPILENLVDSYNGTVNSKTKFTPRQLMNNPKLSDQAWNNQYRDLIAKPPGKPTLAVGQYVRIANNKLIFEKGYEQTHTQEIFIIDQVVETESVPMYRLRSIDGNKIASLFYAQQLFVVPSLDNSNE